MSSIRNITASSAVPDDLAKRLGPSGVNEILLTLSRLRRIPPPLSVSAGGGNVHTKLKSFHESAKKITNYTTSS